MIRVAIVEDYKLVCEGFKVLINQYNDMEVVNQYYKAEEWILGLKSDHYDVVLVDIKLPGKDGIVALQEALSIKPGIKAIMFTMYDDVSYFREAFVAGAKGFVIKNMSVVELTTAIRHVYGGHTFFSDDFLKQLAKSLRKDREGKLGRQITYSELSDQEYKMLSLICKGYTNRQLAEIMFLSIKSIESKKTRLMRKTKTCNNAGLIVWAVKNNIVSL